MKKIATSHSARLFVRLAALAVAAMAFSSCRTSEGFGQDLQHLGNKIENEAERRQ
jgi:predicted small secreted protein